MAARCGCTSGTLADAPAASAVAPSLEAEAAAGLDRTGLPSASPTASEQTKRACSTFLIAAAAQGRSVAAYGAPGKAQHAAQLLRDPDRPRAVTSSIATRTSTGDSRRARASRSSHPTPCGEAQPDVRLDPALEPARPRSSTSWATRAAGAARFMVAIPDARVRPPAAADGAPADEGRHLLRRAGLRLREYAESDPQADGADRAPTRSCGTSCATTRTSATGTSSCALAIGPMSIKDYFLRYNEALSNDFVLAGGGREIELLSHRTSLTGGSPLSTPGLHAPIGQRLRAVRHHLEGEEMFLANYGDILTDAPLDELIARLPASGHRWRPSWPSAAQHSFHLVDVGSDDRS